MNANYPCYDAMTYFGDENEVDTKEDQAEGTSNEWFPARVLDKRIKNCTQWYLKRIEL